MFTIECDAKRALLFVRMWGFASVGEVEEFSRAEQKAIAAMGCRSGEFLLLIDAEAAVIQAQDVVAKFMEIIATSPRKARRIAVVRGMSLTRKQVQRILAMRSNTALFATIAEAEEWLFAPDMPMALAVGR